LKISTPLDYEELFRDRVIIINGVGRSGTTIFGKLLASMQETYYLFEPLFLKFGLCSVPAVIFEDYFLPLVQGRKMDITETDWSYYRNYWMGMRKVIPNSRQLALDHIKKYNSRFIIKTTECYCQRALTEIFPNVHFVNIVRNGNDTIQSSLARGWYSDEFMKLFPDYVVDGKIPLIVEEQEDRDNWDEYNQATRCAVVWRTSIEHFRGWLIKYEKLLKEPEVTFMRVSNKYELTGSNLTSKYIDEIRNHKVSQYEDITDQIQEPEKSKYMELMQRLGYK